MTRQQWIAFILLGLLLGTNPARADTILSDFDGTNFGFAFGSWTGQTTPGPTFVTIGGLATEQGGAGNFPFAATNFTGMGVAMTAQLGAGNLASEFQVHLIDGADNRAVFVFPATSFTNTSFATVFVPAPTFNIGPGPVDLTKIVRFLVMGDFSSDDRLEIKIDRIFVTTQADLSVTKIDSPDPVTAGTNLTYTITANNAGPNTAASVSLSDTLPADTTFESVSVPGGWSCSTPAVGAGGTLTCSIASLSALANATFTLVVAVSPSVANGTVLSNTATLSSTTTDPDPGNNSATATTTVANSADLAITKTDGVANATPGGSVTYTIVASNAGPDGVPDATVADTFPASLTCTWTCVGAGGGTCTAAGSGNLNDTANLPAGGSATYTASCTINASATGTLSNTATITSSGNDPNLGNNSATDTDTLTPQADLSITKTDGVATAVPGGSVTYTITASNPGPSNAPGATVADTFPATLTCTWTCVGAGGGTCTAAGSGNLNDTVNLPTGGSATYTASCTIDVAATGTLSNTATVAAPGGVTDPTPGNNSATDSDTLAPQADLSMTKTDGVTTATPSGSVTYTIVAANAGPSNATGVTVADTFPAACTSVTYSSVAAGGATGNTTVGSGNLNDTLNLPVGASVTYTATCAIALTATGTLSNTATVAAPGGVTDPTPGNNSATDSDTLTQLATLTIQLDAPGSTPTTFDFTTVGGLTPTAFSLQHGQTQTFTNLIPGQSYTINDQAPPPGWVLDEVLCSAPAPECVVGSITLTPTEGQTVTGTFRFLRATGGGVESIPVFSVWGLGALIGLFGLALARLRRRG